MRKALIATTTAGVFLAVFFGLQAGGQEPGADPLQGCVRELVGVELGSADWYAITAAGRVNIRDLCAGRQATAWR